MKLFKNGKPIEIIKNDNGDYYLIERIKTNRNISCKGFSRKKADEVIIVGVSKDKIDSFLKKGNYEWRNE